MTANMWVYFYGTDDGKQIKIGRTRGALKERRKGIETGQLTNVTLHLLAAVRTGRPHIEKELHTYFDPFKADVNSTEAFRAETELVEYVNWLRQQWWTALSEDEGPDDVPDTTVWCPAADRRVPLETADPSALLQTYETFGALAGTPWAAMATPSPIGNDFYTPVELVTAAREAMGGIDLDPASHWLANRVHRIPVYYHLGRRAEDNEWFGRVWLNPPYGNNAPWFDQIIKYWDAGSVSQLCMVSPIWVFKARQARPVLDRASVLMLLSPTPQFWGQKTQVGANHPHALVYLGGRVREFVSAFREFGVPMRLLDEGEGLHP